MTDIVERARAKAEEIAHQVRGQDIGDWNEITLLREAASEIEHLRAKGPAPAAELNSYSRESALEESTREVVEGLLEDLVGLGANDACEEDIEYTKAALRKYLLSRRSAPQELEEGEARAQESAPHPPVPASKDR